MNKILALGLILLFFNGCSTIPENTEQMIYLMGSELQYSLDNKAWEEKYGNPKEVELNKKPFPYSEVEKERGN